MRIFGQKLKFQDPHISDLQVHQIQHPITPGAELVNPEQIG